MNFTSYAQNQEDVVLWRALKHIGCGKYLDIGAQHPVIDSVSKAFYERGWRGVHIEPVAQYAELLRLDRPDETILEIAISDTNEYIPFFVIPDTGLSTGNPSVARLHDSKGFTTLEAKVKARTLDSVLQAFGSTNIHWMKIDVEGMEAQVLKSWHDCSARPWVVIIESTMPNSTIHTEAEWEHEVINRGYAFALFDGLNRYYVHNLHRNLLGFFYAGANSLDQFVTYRQLALEFELASLKARNHELKKRLSSNISLLGGWAGDLLRDITIRHSELMDVLNEDARFMNEVEPLSIGESRRYVIAEGHATSILDSGFSKPESWGTWTNTKTSVISIPLKLDIDESTLKEANQYLLNIRMPVKLYEGLLSRSPVMRVLNENEELLYVLFRAGIPCEQDIELSIVVTKSPVKIIFELTHLADPADLAEGSRTNDSRNIGFAVTWIEAKLFQLSQIEKSSNTNQKSFKKANSAIRAKKTVQAKPIRNPNGTQARSRESGGGS